MTNTKRGQSNVLDSELGPIPPCIQSQDSDLLRRSRVTKITQLVPTILNNGAHLGEGRENTNAQFILLSG